MTKKNPSAKTSPKKETAKKPQIQAKKPESRKPAILNLASLTSTAPQKSGRVRVFIVDDHPVVRRGVAELINREADLNVCGDAEDFEKALETIGKLQPDLFLIDISVNGSNGIDFLKILKKECPHASALVLSMHDEILYAESALREGARGYIMKQEAGEQILTAIRKILSGQIYLSDNMRERILEKQYGSVAVGASPLEVLSKRELEVFEMIGDGQTTSAIARQLKRSIKTIETYRARIKDKLNLKDNMELIRHAVHWPSHKSNEVKVA